MLVGCVPEQLHQPELPEAVPSSTSHQASQTGGDHTDPSVDLRPVLQGTDGAGPLAVTVVPHSLSIHTRLLISASVELSVLAVAVKPTAHGPRLCRGQTRVNAVECSVLK